MKYQLTLPEHDGQPIVLFIVLAWQYGKQSPIPMWVARKFHDLGLNGEGDGLTAIIGDEFIEVSAGDWIVTDSYFEDVTVVRDEVFKKIFIPL